MFSYNGSSMSYAIFTGKLKRFNLQNPLASEQMTLTHSSTEGLSINLTCFYTRFDIVVTINWTVKNICFMCF